jgi:quercetin dioxygenase-like cupin family protein
MHVHANEDEFYYVLEGDHVFQRGDETVELGPGGFVFLPRGVPHGHRRVVPTVGRLLTVLSPAGLEGFFRELAEADRAGHLDDAAYAAASERYGITWVS